MMANPYGEFPPYPSNPGPALLDGLVRHHPLRENLHPQHRHRHDNEKDNVIPVNPGINSPWLHGTHEDPCDPRH